MTERVVVTGVGVVAPTGVGVTEYWAATVAGRRAVAPISRYDAGPYPLKLAGEVLGFDPAEAIPSRIAVQTDRYTQFALVAADLALRDADLDPAELPPYSVGATIASCSGGVEFGQHEIERLWHIGPSHVGPYQSIAWFYAASTGQVSIRHGLKGPCGVLVTDEPGGLDSIGHAVRTISRGTDVVLAGGAEAPLAPFSMTCQFGHGLLSLSTDPVSAYQPFTAAACGFVPAEGGAVLVCESERSARSRGARPLAVVAGHAATFSSMFSYDPSGEGLAAAIRGALAAADRRPDQVEVIFADGLGTPAADLAEVRALTAVFGRRTDRIPVTAPKAGIGRAYAGAGALDAGTAVLSLWHGVIPPTPTVAEPCHPLDLVTAARTERPGSALVLSRGLGGGNSALLLEHPDFH